MMRSSSSSKLSPSSGGNSCTNAIAALTRPSRASEGQDRERLGPAGDIGVMWVAAEQRANICGPRHAPAQLVQAVELGVVQAQS